MPGQIAFGRGGRGFFVLNRTAKDLEADLPTGMSPGDYCDVTAGAPDGAGGCSGPSVTVRPDGSATFTLPPWTARAIHAEATAR